MMARILMMFLASVTLHMAGHADIANPLRAVWQKQPAPLPPTIKVLIAHDQPSATLEVKGKYKLYDPNKKAPLVSTRFVGKSQLIQPTSGGLKWGEEFPGTYQIQVIPMAADTQIYVNGLPYQGSILIYDIGGSISIVNDLPVEDFLRSILATRYPQNLSSEALAALVIAARTNAYYYAQNPKSQFWAVDGMKEGFKGYVPTDPKAPIQQAIKNTRFMVLSKTSLYEGIVTPFAINWDPIPGHMGGNVKAASSQISMAEVDEMAKKGSHAAAILDKAFPKASIQLIQFSER